MRTVRRAPFARTGLRPAAAALAFALAAAGARADAPVGTHSDMPLGMHSDTSLGTRTDAPVGTHADAPLGTRSDPPFGAHADPSLGTHPDAAPGITAPPVDTLGAAPTPVTDAERLTAMARFFETAEPPSRDLARARDLYCRAAALADGAALHRLARMYLLGRGVPVDEAVGATLLRWAASLEVDGGAAAPPPRPAATSGGRPDSPAPCLVQAGVGSLEALLARRRPHVPPADTAQVLAAPAKFRTGAAPVEQRRIVEMVVQQARAFRLDPRLVLAIVRTESNFDPAALSPKNAQGLMQLIPDTAKRFGVIDALDPLEKLKGGMAYLRWLLAYYRGDVALSLAAYNAGEGAVDRFRGVPPYAETIAYVQRIRALYPFDRHPFETRTAPGAERAWIARELASTDAGPSRRGDPAAGR